MAVHSSRPRRNRQPRTAAQIINRPATDAAEETPMVQQAQQPAVVIETDDALDRLWSPHNDALTDAHESGRNAEPFERDRDARRLEAKAKREEADRLIAEAAEAEAAANADHQSAQRFRQDEAHYRQVAHEIAMAVDFLRGNKMHPAERRKLLEQQAAANAAHDPLNAPIGSLGALVSGSGDPSATAPHLPMNGEATP